MKQEKTSKEFYCGTVYVDADACPVKQEIVSVCSSYGIPVVMFLDTSHVYEDGYSRVVMVDKGADKVDFALINHVLPNDIVVSQDYGVAMMALAKRAVAIHHNGKEYMDETMGDLLMSRYVSQKVRRSGGRVSGPKKRTRADDAAFVVGFQALVERMIEIWEEVPDNS